MSQVDPKKQIAELEAYQSELDAELEKLGIGSLDEFDETQIWKGYPEIVRIAHEAGDTDLLPAIDCLIEEGADLNARSPFGETALDQCFARSAFDAVRRLIENGADHTTFEWSEAHLNIALGRVPDILADAPSLMERDAGGRSPFLQACRFGNIAAAKYLHDITPPEGKHATPDGEGPVVVAVRSGSMEMLDWVLAQGYDVDEEDKFGATALLEAVEHNRLKLVERLLNAGADVRKGRNTTAANADAQATSDSADSVFGKAANLIMQSTANLVSGLANDIDDCITTPASAAHSPDIIRLLAQFGAPIEDFESEDVPAVTGADQIAATTITPDMFHQQAMPREGQANPEKVDIPFWREQIRTGRSGYSAEIDCIGERDYEGDHTPIWSFQRYGRTATRLPDGRWVLIAGEHEDYYDPDFCIYSDVTVIHPDARMDHYIYSTSVFPPTDFHTATLLGDHILLIGSLVIGDNAMKAKRRFCAWLWMIFQSGRWRLPAKTPGGFQGTKQHAWRATSSCQEERSNPVMSTTKMFIFWT